MCFTPLISIATAVTEFSIAGYIWKKISTRKHFPLVVFIVLLGMYQFTEFMLCTTSNDIWWVKIGMIAYTALPAVLYHQLMNFAGKRARLEVYAFTALFSAMILFQPLGLVESVCNLLHVSIHAVAFNSNIPIRITYWTYYIVYPAVGFFFFTQYIAKQKRAEMLKTQIKIAISIIPMAILLSQLFFVISLLFNVDATLSWEVSSFLVILSMLSIIGIACVPMIKKTSIFMWAMQYVLVSSLSTALILYAIYPEFGYDYPSIYCQFSLLYTLAIILIVKNLDEIPVSK
jgi:hypothetical protein